MKGVIVANKVSSILDRFEPLFLPREGENTVLAFVDFLDAMLYTEPVRAEDWDNLVLKYTEASALHSDGVVDLKVVLELDIEGFSKVNTQSSWVFAEEGYRLPLVKEIREKYFTVNNWLLTGGEGNTHFASVDVSFDGRGFNHWSLNRPRGSVLTLEDYVGPSGMNICEEVGSLYHGGPLTWWSRIVLLKSFGTLLRDGGIEGPLTLATVKNLLGEESFTNLFDLQGQKNLGWPFLSPDMGGEEYVLGPAEVRQLKEWADLTLWGDLDLPDPITSN